MDLRGKVVAVTGGFGTLGTAVVAAARAAGAEVAALDNAASPDRVGADAGVTYVAEVDLTSLEQGVRAFSRRWTLQRTAPTCRTRIFRNG